VHNKRQIETKLIASRGKLLRAVEGLSDAGWQWRPADGRWSVRLILAHVGAAQWDHLEAANRFLAGQPVALPGFDLDAWNAAAVAQRDSWTVEQIRADLDAVHQATLAFLEALDAEQLSVAGSHPASGEVSVGQILRVIALHDNLHRRDVFNLRREMNETAEVAER
jgi:uncharacterized damage-inducible protein DinB